MWHFEYSIFIQYKDHSLSSLFIHAYREIVKTAGVLIVKAYHGIRAFETEKSGESANYTTKPQFSPHSFHANTINTPAFTVHETATDLSALQMYTIQYNNTHSYTH